MRTTFGDGVIIANLGVDGAAGPRYRVKFPFGIGFVRSHAIMHGIESPDGAKFVRRDGVMEKGSTFAVDERESSVKLDNKFKLLFGSECIYLFIRLYTSLVSLLDEVESCIQKNPTANDPTTEYYDPMKSQEDKEVPTLDFPAVINELKNVVAGTFSPKEYEAFCRRVSPDFVHKMAALPKLVERGANMLKKTAEEDLLLSLYDYCQFTGVVSIVVSMIHFGLSVNLPHSRYTEPRRTEGEMSFNFPRHGFSNSV